MKETNDEINDYTSLVERCKQQVIQPIEMINGIPIPYDMIFALVEMDNEATDNNDPRVLEQRQKLIDYFEVQRKTNGNKIALIVLFKIIYPIYCEVNGIEDKYKDMWNKLRV